MASASDWRRIADGPGGGARAAEALLVPAILYSNTVRMLPSHLADKPVQAGACYCLLSPLGALTQPLCVFPLNYELRRQVFPAEAECKAVSLSLCCAACSMAEAARELDRRRTEKVAMGAAPRVQRMSYGCDSKYCQL